MEKEKERRQSFTRHPSVTHPDNFKEKVEEEEKKGASFKNGEATERAASIVDRKRGREKERERE